MSILVSRQTKGWLEGCDTTLEQVSKYKILLLLFISEKYLIQTNYPCPSFKLKTVRVSSCSFYLFLRVLVPLNQVTTYKLTSNYLYSFLFTNLSSVSTSTIYMTNKLPINRIYRFISVRAHSRGVNAATNV